MVLLTVDVSGRGLMDGDGDTIRTIATRRDVSQTPRKEGIYTLFPKCHDSPPGTQIHELNHGIDSRILLQSNFNSSFKS